MTERRVRTPRNTNYGRPQPVRSRRPSRSWHFRLGLVPRRLLILAGLLLLVLIGLHRLFLISNIQVNAPSAADRIRALAQTDVHGSWRQDNLITLNATKLASAVASDPQVKGVKINRKWPNSILVSVTLKQPSIGWSSGNQAYVLDRDGSVIGALAAGDTRPVVVDGSNVPVQLGQRVAGSRFVTFVTDVSAAMSSLKLGPTRLEVKETTLDLTATTTAGYSILWDTSRAAGDEVADLQTILASLKSQGKAPQKYIDLRISGKAYYQ